MLLDRAAPEGDMSKSGKKAKTTSEKASSDKGQTAGHKRGSQVCVPGGHVASQALGLGSYLHLLCLLSSLLAAGVQLHALLGLRALCLSCAITTLMHPKQVHRL